jgi:hypothetical protein
MARLSELAGVALPAWSGSHDGAASGHQDRGSQGVEPTLGFEPRTGAGQAGGQRAVPTAGAGACQCSPGGMSASAAFGPHVPCR